MSIEKGKRYESKQDPGRVVQVKHAYPVMFEGETRNFTIQVIANEKNPKTVGRRTTVTEKTLTTRYKELSH